MPFCHFVKIYGKGIYTTCNKVYHGGIEMEMVRKVVCLLALVSVLSLPALAGSNSESDISDFGIKYMDCQFDSGYMRGPTSDDPTNIDSGINTPSPLEYENDEGSCGLSLPDSSETEIPSPPPESPRVPIPPEEKPGEQQDDEEEEPEKPQEEEPEEDEELEKPKEDPNVEDPYEEKPDSDNSADADDDDDDSSLDSDDDIMTDIDGDDFSGPELGIKVDKIVINDGEDSISGESGDPIPPVAPPGGSYNQQGTTGTGTTEITGITGTTGTTGQNTCGI